MTFEFKGEDFTSLIRKNEYKIIKRGTSGINENDNFKRLLASLKTYQNNHPVTGFLAILIDYGEIENLYEKIIDNINIQLGTVRLATNNHIIVDRNFDVILSERKLLTNGNDVRRIYTEISNEYCVFHISNQGVHYFIYGYDVGDSIFYSSADQDRFNKLKDINQIDELIHEYQINLRQRNTYSKFFVPNSGKIALHRILRDNDTTVLSIEDFLEDNKQLLNNKPEDIFREDLRIFLVNKLQGSFLGKEYILENFRRLDIFIRDNFGELYLIEVKWIGLSIHAKGDNFGICYQQRDISPDAVIQSIEYIKELYETNQKIKIGFLAVFDAQSNKSEKDSCENFDMSQLSDDLKLYSAQFNKFPDLRVENLNPR